MAQVDVSQVKKSYGNQSVIHGLDLNIRSGEFMVLVGPSGCGKSTLLRMVAGLEEITEGSISIDGKVVNSLSPKERGVAMVFQNYALYPHMTVWDNMAFSLKLSKLPHAEIEKRVREAAKVLAIEDHLKKKPGQLSGGQKQRVAMGRAMVRQPSVFLFDEPLSNLDAQLRVKMRSEISMLHRRLKSTIIYVTHDQVEAMTLADRVAILYKGKLEQVGAPLEVYHNPKTKFVASFIGTPSMNFMNAANFPRKTPSGTTEVGFRPEVTMLKVESDGASAQDSIALGRGRVTLVEPLGLTALVHLSLGNETVVAEMRKGPFPEIDSECDVSISQKQLFFFDREGNRVQGEVH